MLSKCQKRKSSLILDEGICKENVYAESSHQDFENRSKNAAFQKKSEFYYTFLLRLCKKLESETKSWSKILQIWS